jgi:hypothetical protein
MRNRIALGLLALGLASVACDEKKDVAPASTGAPSAANKPANTGEPKVGEAKETPPEPKSLTVAQFTTDAPAAACKVLATCKNEEVTASISAMMVLIAGFASLKDKAMQDELKAVGDAMKKENRHSLNGDECTKVMGAITKATGFNAEKIQASIDAKKVEFNAEKAAACSAALSTPPKACAEEKKLTGEPKMEDLDKMMKGYEKDFEEYLKPCQEAFVGKVAAGEACENDFECAGEKVECKQNKCAKKAE